MKKFRSFITFILILTISAGCLASCAPSKNIDFTQPVDEIYTAFRQSDGVSGAFLEVNYGCYILYDKYVYYSDATSLDYIKLCGKPDCTHNTRDCNAYTGAYSIGVYKDHLFYTSLNNEYICCLYQMNLDGSAHKKIFELDDCTNGFTGVFHSGYLYYVKSNLPVNEGEQIDDGFYRIALSEGSEPEKITTNENIGSPYIRFYNDNIYCTRYFTDRTTLYCYSIVNNTWTLISEDWGPNGCYFNDKKAYCYKTGIGFYEYDYTAHELKLIAKTEREGKFVAIYTSDYICLVQGSNAKTLDGPLMYYFYDWEYNLIDSVEIDIPVVDYRLGTFYANTKKYILLSVENKLTLPGYYIDKSEIGTGNITVRKIGE